MLFALFTLDAVDRFVNPKKKESSRIVNLDKFWTEKPSKYLKAWGWKT